MVILNFLRSIINLFYFFDYWSFWFLISLFRFLSWSLNFRSGTKEFIFVFGWFILSFLIFHFDSSFRIWSLDTICYLNISISLWSWCHLFFTCWLVNNRRSRLVCSTLGIIHSFSILLLGGIHFCCSFSWLYSLVYFHLTNLFIS